MVKMIIKTALSALLILAGSVMGFAQDADMDFGLVEHLWQLETYRSPEGDTVEVLEGSRITADFDSGELNGSAGCNSYFGRYGVNNMEIGITEVGSTLMACADEALMQQETAYLNVLREVASYRVQEDQLELLNADDEVILTFGVLEPAPLVGTVWLMTGYADQQGGVVSALPEPQVTAVFHEDQQLAGFAGCNSYNAVYEAEDDSLSIAMVVSTLVACENPEGVMEQEQAYLGVLESVATYEIRADTLQLKAEDGAVLVTFRAQMAITGIEWQWQRTETREGEAMDVPDPAAYTLLLNDNDTFFFVADCNQGNGTYTLSGDQISLETGQMTLVACPEGSLSNDYLNHLTSVASFALVDGSLHLMPGMNGEVLVFEAAAAAQQQQG